MGASSAAISPAIAAGKRRRTTGLISDRGPWGHPFPHYNVSENSLEHEGAIPVKRSRELIITAFFLSKYNEMPDKPGSKPRPPGELGVKIWRRAYAMFYRALGGGRTLSVFVNSLKNARDNFDSHTDSGRIGWRAEPAAAGPDRPPRPLNEEERKVLETWSQRPRKELWALVRQWCDEGVRAVSEVVLADLSAELDPEKTTVIARTEGGRRVVISARIERDPSLRDAALRIHGTICIVCGFSFGKVYGEWGEGFAIVHHLQALGGETAGQRDTDPATDLVVLCGNCHCMVHRKQRIVLSVAELKSKLQYVFDAAYRRLPVTGPPSDSEPGVAGSAAGDASGRPSS